MELADKKIVFDDINVTVKIFDIREGESGNKKSFLEIKDDILMLKEMKWQKQQAKSDKMLASSKDILNMLTESCEEIAPKDVPVGERENVPEIVDNLLPTATEGSPTSDNNASNLSGLSLENNASVSSNNRNNVSEEEEDEAIEPIRVVIAGGDGTIMWGMMELGIHFISADDIVVASLPLGTGEKRMVLSEVL